MSDDTQQTMSAADLAQQIQATTKPLSEEEELERSNQVAQTLQFLQNVIERNANELERLKKELKEKRESIKNIFENDSQLTEASEAVQKVTDQVKQRKSQLVNDPQVTGLKNQVGELQEQKKELEEALSNHLINYFTLTNSKSFDTSDGDQWDFTIAAKVKGRGGKNDE